MRIVVGNLQQLLGEVGANDGLGGGDGRLRDDRRSGGLVSRGEESGGGVRRAVAA